MFDHIPPILEMEDKLNELRFLANTAATLAKNVTQEENHPSHGNYLTADEWIEKELFPFFQTLRFRLPEIHAMIMGMLKKCEEGCAFGKVSEEDEPEQAV